MGVGWYGGFCWVLECAGSLQTPGWFWLGFLQLSPAWG